MLGIVLDKKNKIEIEIAKIKKEPFFYAIYYFLKHIFNQKVTENTKKNYKSQVFKGVRGVLNTDEIKELKDKINKQE